MLLFLKKYLSGKARSMGLVLRLVRELSEIELCKLVMIFKSFAWQIAGADPGNPGCGVFIRSLG